MTAIGVLIGGGIGALARFGMEGVIAQRQRSPFPLSTLIVNVSGSAVLGIIVGLAGRGTLSLEAAVWLGTGVVGGYTTFSTFTYETVRLIEDGAWRYAGLNILLSGPLSFAAAAGTFLLARSI